MQIYKTNTKSWDFFKKFHYLNTEIHKASECYVGFFEDNPVCFFAVIHFPHPNVKNFKRGHRLVVLPDYQGLGIGHKFSSIIAQQYIDKGFRFVITSSTKSLFTQRSRDPRWAITFKGRQSKYKESSGKNVSVGVSASGSRARLTYSYEYIGDRSNHND